MIDIHVHPFIPILGRIYGAWFHNFDLSTMKWGKNIYCISFYEICLPTRKWAHRKLLDHIEIFVNNNRPNIIGTIEELDAFVNSNRKEGECKNHYILGIESLRPITDLERLGQLREMGARYLQPVHFWDNDFAHSYRMGLFKPSGNGLSAFGMELLKEMERLGFIIDITHMNAASMEDVMERFSGPIICSHTGLREIRATTRNIPQHIAIEIFRRKGLLGITPWKQLLGKTLPFNLHSWNQAFCKTILSIVELGGEKGISIGSDRGAPLHIHADFFTDSNLKKIKEILNSEGLGDDFFDDLLENNALNFFRRALPKFHNDVETVSIG